MHEGPAFRSVGSCEGCIVIVILVQLALFTAAHIALECAGSLVTE